MFVATITAISRLLNKRNNMTITNYAYYFILGPKPVLIFGSNRSGILSSRDCR